ncbi:VIT1/CCC1 transporter family protein [Candidatus Pacearchaeota archaeon]|nr:VIT1/CCC1 transporter family protein [Candidatus Pacearchaeota archaeon]
MRKSLHKQREMIEKHSRVGALFKEFILGGQDGLVNVLGVILGIAIATSDSKLVIIAGLAAAFAESFSMAAVAYTSAKTEEDYYNSQKKQEEYEVKTIPKKEKEEIYDIFYKKGFRGKLLNDIVKHVTSNKKVWIDIMMADELGLSNEFINPVKSAIVVGLAAILGSFIPLTAFFFMPINSAIIWSLIISAIALFITGAVEGKITIGKWFKRGIQLAVIGMVAAGIGFLIGKILGVQV